MRTVLRPDAILAGVALALGSSGAWAQAADSNYTAADLAALQAAADAACEEDRARIDGLIASRTDLNAPDDEGLLPLHRAIGCDFGTVRRLLAAGANPNARNPETDEAPLNLAASQAIGDVSAGQVEGAWATFDLLLDRGADLNAVNSAGQTVMTQLAFFGHFDGVYRKIFELLDRGYSHDLNYLGRAIETGEGMTSGENEVWRSRVIEKLRSKGVEFPVGPRGPQEPAS